MLDTQALYELSGKKKTLHTQKVELLAQLEESEQVIQFEKGGYDILAALQKEFATSSVKLYSDLLTAIVQDVMGDRVPTIELQPTVISNQPALNIEAVVDGRREDVVQSQGGGVNNLLAAGFRFIALALSSNRRFVILDEPDCWVSVDLVPRFIEVLDALCEKMGVQAIFISHHQHARELPVYKIILDNSDGMVRATVNDERPTIEKDRCESEFNSELLDGLGIRSIRLTNYMSHKDTELSLAAGLTTIIAPNNLGKSVITRAMYELMNNIRQSSRIRDGIGVTGVSVASVTVTVENDVQIIWSLQKRKQGNPDGTYVIKTASGEVIELHEKVTEVPDCINDYLQMPALADGKLDFHIGDQKDPLFVLNPAISKFKRAEIIKLGDEYTRINEATKLHRDKILSAKRQKTSCMERLDELNQDLTKLAPVDKVLQLTEALQHDEPELKAMNGQLGDLAHLSQLTNEKAHRDIAHDLTGQLARKLNRWETDVEDHTEQHNRLGKFLKASESQFSSVSIARDLMEATTALEQEASELQDQESLLKKLELASNVNSALHGLESVQSMLLGLNEYAVLIMADYKMLTRYFAHEEALNEQRNEVNELRSELEDVNVSLNALTEQNGGICPLCEQPVSTH